MTWSSARWVVAVVAVAAALLTRGATARAQSTPWTGTWGASPQSGGGQTYNQQTIRQIVFTSISGTSARLRLSNKFGSQTVTLADVHLALAGSGSAIQAGTDHPVTFAGATTVSVAAGADVTSDAVSMSIPALSSIAVSFYLPSSTVVQTVHQNAFQTNYVASGDVASSLTLSSPSTVGSYIFLTNLDVQNASATGAVVTLGASITDAFQSTPNTNRRWPNLLAQRLSQAGVPVGVINQGISANQLLADASGTLSAQHRFAHDVVGQPNVRWVIFSDDPINDVGNNPSITGAQLIAGAQQIVSAAHAAGLRFLCSTLTPFQGAGYWTSAGETAREQFNAFVRGAGSGCDGVVDQDTATHDPANPTKYLPAYDAGDHLHPNDAGMQAIANAVNLSLLSATGEGAFSATPAPIPGVVENENYDIGGEGVAYHDGDTANQGGQYRTAEAVDVETCGDSGGGFDVGWTGAGEWLKYTVNVAAAGAYTVTFRVASPSGGASLHLQTPSGTNLTGAVAIGATGGWQTYQNVVANLTLPAGQQTIELFEDSGGFNLNKMTFAAVPAGEGPFSGTPAAIPGVIQFENYDTGGEGVAYHDTDSVNSGGRYRSDGVDVEACGDTGGGFDVGWTNSGEWLKYTVNVATAKTYTVSIRVAAAAAVGTTAGHFHIQTPSGTNLSGSIAVPGTGGWQTYTTVTATVTLPAGQQILQVFEDSGGFNLNSMTF